MHGVLTTVWSLSTKILTRFSSKFFMTKLFSGIIWICKCGELKYRQLFSQGSSNERLIIQSNIASEKILIDVSHPYVPHLVLLLLQGTQTWNTIYFIC